MTSLFDALPYLVPYQPAFLIMGIMSLIPLVQSVASAPIAFANMEQIPGMPLKHDHSKLSFRAIRTYANSVENLPAFIGALMVAIVAGVSPVLVNWLVAIHLVFRLAFWGVYYSGIGRVSGGPRTLCYIGGMLTNAVLGVAAIYALL